MQILLTAGPTHEPIDSVRYIANRSSGRIGLALAQAALDAGHKVTLLLGPVAADPPQGVRCYGYQTTADLQALLDRHFPECDVLIMAAAVADYRPLDVIPDKISRGANDLTLRLEPTPDLVAQCTTIKRPDQRVIGFALEKPTDLDGRAREKLHNKQLDAIIANPLETMDAEDITATVYTPGANPIAPGKMTKREFARWLIHWIGE